MSNEIRPNVRHLSDEQLLMLTDGELTERETARARQHVDGCWSCRERLDRLQSAINSITRRRNEMLELGGDGPSRPWDNLEARFDVVDTVLDRRSALGRLLQSLRVSLVMHRTPWIAATATALLVLAVLLTHEPALSASELLVRADAATAPAPTEVIHRTLQLEQRRLPDRHLLKRQRIEIWQGTAQGKARRLYDDKQGLAAGEWTRPDGSRTIYRPGEPPAIEQVSQSRAPLNDRDVWRWEPSAGDFLAAAGSADVATVEERDDVYLLAYRPATGLQDGLLEAHLTLNKSNLRAMSQTFVVRERGEDREYRLSETSFERISVESVVPAVFQVEPLLLSEPVTMTAAVTPSPVTPVVAPPVETAPSETELDRLELDATYQLYRSRIWVGQQGEVSRTPAGVAVDATVPNEYRKSILERDFAHLQATPAVTVNITVGDDVSPTEGAKLLADPTALRAIPAYALLEKFFGTVPAEGRDDAIRGIAVWVLERVQRRAERLRALRTLIEQWPAQRLLNLELERVVRWQAMLQEHAEAVRHETELLRVQLASALGVHITAPKTDNSRQTELLSVATVGRASAQLMKQAAAQDDLLKVAFMPCRSGVCGGPDVERLMRTFTDIESLAARFAAPWSLGR